LKGGEELRSPREGVPETCFEDQKPEHSNISRERYSSNRGKREAGEVGRRWRARGSWKPNEEYGTNSLASLRGGLSLFLKAL